MTDLTIENHVIDAADWDEFEQTIKLLQKTRFERGSSLLFRGQSNSAWKLETTLERTGCARMFFRDYYYLTVAKIGPSVESYTGTIGPVFDQQLVSRFADRELLTMHRFPQEPLYSYLIYLRHHGFPSPLLDWSHSPYVAAFFAFREPLKSVDKVVIYCFCEQPEGLKSGLVGGPTIRQTGRYVRGHRRHFRQQSDYTICGEWDQSMGLWAFCSYEQVLTQPRPKQDELWKIMLPSTERTKVLRMLDDHNLNAFSLFDSEESLLETLWLREYGLKL